MSSCNYDKRDEFDHQMLVRYSIHLASAGEPDYDGSRLTSKEIETISQHVSQCPYCKKKVDQLQNELMKIEDYLVQSGVPGPSKKRGSSGAQFTNQRGLDTSKLGSRGLRRALVGTVTLAAIATACLLLAHERKHVQLAAINPDTALSVVRGDLAEKLHGGLSVSQSDRLATIEYLQKAILEKSSDKQIYYAHFVLGISYLLEAKNSLPGRFRGFDEDLVEKAIHHLEIALNTTNNLGMAEDCIWYIGKAYLMKKDWQKAGKSFRQVIEYNGRRLSEAEQLTDEISRLGDLN